METISFDEFQKVDIRVGFVDSCDRVEKSAKLLKLVVDFGVLGMKTVLTGLGETLNPEVFLNKKILFAFNVEPRKIMGIESQAVIMGTDEEHPKLVYCTDDMIPGTRVI